MLAETHHRLLSSLHASTATSTRGTRFQSSNKSGFVVFNARRLRFGTKRNTSRFRAWKPISSSTTKDETTTEALRKDDYDEEKGAMFQGVYEFAKHRCYYERKGDLRKAKVHVIFLHGFGVGTFHYRKQLNALGGDEEVCAWSMDICGQGKSWPRSGEDVRDFEYSMDSWRDQVEYFVREVVLKSSSSSVKVVPVSYTHLRAHET